MVQSHTTTKYGAFALHAGCLRLQTQHSEYVILIFFSRHRERVSVLCWYVHWPFLFFPTNLATLLSQTPVNLLLFFLFNLLHNLHCLLSRNTNKMQLCNIIYYSKVHWRLNMFRAAHRSSSGALNCICSLWFIYTCGDRPLSRLSGSPHRIINHRLQIQFRAPDDERCAARNMLSLQRTLEQ